MADLKISELTYRPAITGSELIPLAIGGQNFSTSPGDIKNYIATGLPATNITDTTQSTNKDTGCLILEGGLGVEKNVNAGGVLGIADTTDSTSKDTGSIITEGGIGVEKSVYVGTILNVGTNQTFSKELAHTLSVSDSTTANTAGGSLTAKAGNGFGTANGGNFILKSGDAGLVGGFSGETYLETGTSPAFSGDLFVRTGTGTTASGAVVIKTGAGGTTSNISLTTGEASSGTSGKITLDCGTTASTTVSSTIEPRKNIVKKLSTATVASGGTITGKQLVDGYIAATGATGNWQLPTTAAITTAIGGTTPAGTSFDFCINAVGMTATNTLTLVVGSNMTVSSSPAITGGGSLTLTQDTQVVGWWKITYVTATTCKIQRIT